MTNVLLFVAIGVLLPSAPGLLGQTAQVQVGFGERLGPLDMDHMGLGQGGLSDEPMWADRRAEIRILQPRLIRLFVQEYFDLLPGRGRYHFETLDRSVDTILQTGARPLMCLCFKPRRLFPEINQDAVEPVDYARWDKLISALVRHYRERKAGIEYWEVANEPDIGEDGGCPYRFQPESYLRYYRHTAGAILGADPQARVGGPALASAHSAILPALLKLCETERVPLHFVSWHIYNSDPRAIGETVRFVRELLQQHPGLHPQTVLDEWNMDLTNPPLDPRFQPCFVCEAIWQMKAAGLDYSCYYQIRDWYVRFDQFRPFMSEKGTAFMTRWWNRMPQFDGLFDFQNQVRPAYYAFKLLSRLRGQRLPVTSNHPAVHGFASHDAQLRMDNLVLWNFSGAAMTSEISLQGLSPGARVRHLRLNAAGAGRDENLRLEPEPFFRLDQAHAAWKLTFAPYEVDYWSFE